MNKVFSIALLFSFCTFAAPLFAMQQRVTKFMPQRAIVSSGQSVVPIGQNSFWFEAAKKGDLETIKSLFQKNSELINRKNNDGKTALDLAIISVSIKGFDKVVIYLIENGADITKEVKETSKTPFLLMITEAPSYNINVVEAILKRDTSEINKSFFDGETPLTITAIRKDRLVEKWIIMLLKYGADIDQKNTCGLSALEVALKYENYTAAKILVANGAKFGQQSSKEVKNVNDFQAYRLPAACDRFDRLIKDNKIEKISNLTVLADALNVDIDMALIMAFRSYFIAPELFSRLGEDPVCRGLMGWKAEAYGF